MVPKINILIFGVIFLLFTVGGLNLISADFEDCWQYSGTSESICIISGGDGCQWETAEEDPWCDFENGCCMNIGCWDYDGTNQSFCEASDGSMNCTWDPYFTMWYPNGTQSDIFGGCMGDDMWGYW